MKNKTGISIVIPARNEAKRLPLFLDKLLSYCRDDKNRYEIIVVDDASNDNTCDIAASYKCHFPIFHIIKIKKKKGKGYAVKIGLLRSSKAVCVFTDADGSFDPDEIGKNLHYLEEEGYDIFIGSRALRGKSQILEGKWYRKIVGFTFNFLVQTLLFKNVKDTQCGFKMFKKEVVNPIFSRMYLNGFGFDIEMLYLAYKMGYKVKEGTVSCHHVTGSKVHLIFHSLQMFFNILEVRSWHCTSINPLAKYMDPDEYAYMYKMEKYHWWFVCRNNFVENFLKFFNPPHLKILDVGCGRVGNLMAFSSLGNIFGIDVSSQGVSFCASRGLKNIAQCTANKIPFKDKTFDMVIYLDVLQYLPEPTEALFESRRILKDNGKIIITVPAFRILWSQHDETFSYLRRYEKHSLLEEIEEAGLKVERMNYLFFASFLVVAPIRIIREFLLPRKEKVQSDTITLPPEPVNRFLKFLFNIETKVSMHFRLPFGTTLYAIVSKGKN